VRVVGEEPIGRPAASRVVQPFRHEALFHAGDDEFVAGVLPFIRGAFAAREPILVAVSAAKVARLRAALGVDAQAVQFADMATLGRNPARIIPAWEAFVEENHAPGRRLWGIGEPIWPERSAAELSECYRHECLLNVAFANADGFTLLCPYDTAALDPAVVERARHSHPILTEHGRSADSAVYSETAVAAPFSEVLPEPTEPPRQLHFAEHELGQVRMFLRAFAQDTGLSRERTNDLVLAIHEIAANSVRHGGGRGALLLWQDGGEAVCEVSDSGRIDAPLVGRLRPARSGQIGGYGVWLANQLCELVQVRSFDSGGVVRVRMHAA
jgi:anti-sigma regulatory factor (Ser/Thr protein kinase)